MALRPAEGDQFMSKLWIPTPEQEAEIEVRIAAAVATRGLYDDLQAALVDAASKPAKAKAIAKTAAGILVKALAPLVAEVPLAPAALALLPELLDQL
jgi:hypothetical protein